MQTLVRWPIALLFLAACSDSAPKPPAAPAVRPSVVLDAAIPAGTVRGEILFDGTAPVRKPLPMGGVADCSGHGQVMTESVIVNGDRLQNVLVHVKHGVDLASVPAAPSEPVVLEQRGCVYVPHVLALRTGQTLRVLNADTFNHNVNAKPQRGDNAGFNRTQAAGAHDEVVFKTGELSVPFVCDIHPWMRAYVHALEHPYFALSAADGAFTISGLAPGKYRVEAVHETFGSQDVEVVLDDQAGARATFHFRDTR